MTREESEAAGWTNVEYDDDVLDFFDKVNAALKAHGLSLEQYNDEPCDGFQPFRIVRSAGV